LALQLEGRRITLIDDTYNANPDSVRAAIEVLAELPAPRLLALGDMGEVGEQGLAFHDEVLRHALARGIEAVHVAGD
ncbi:UDP-N-acetylmuramoyl-tripeptide--D-alanyl-D-alanine ligase, partial [Escherichia coli]|nr:UDP-N-acetylmuramoyl-tripeptide--D-alanyl-D-alanine ligase [Escherichia coli]